MVCCELVPVYEYPCCLIVDDEIFISRAGSCFMFSFAGKLELSAEGKRQYYVYFYSSWGLDADLSCDVCWLSLLPWRWRNRFLWNTSTHLLDYTASSWSRSVVMIWCWVHLLKVLEKSYAGFLISTVSFRTDKQYFCKDGFHTHDRPK